MIPIKLKLRGLYSYQQEQIIDFANLTAANLFGIFGSVGSGKSSILEAISYALYGETERLNKQDKRSYNMMNLRSNELLIDFEFQGGKSHEIVYRFVVSGKRHKTKFEQVGTLERKAYRVDNGEMIPLESANGELITGLSYENFRRTIIIPQGKFQEFLQLTETERTRMLKQIFRLERFDLWDKANFLDKKNTENLKELEGRLSQLGEVNLEMLAEKEIALKAEEEIVVALAKEINIHKKQLDEWERQKEALDRLQIEKEIETTLISRKAEMNKLEMEITQYEKVKNLLGDFIQQEEDNQQAQHQLNRSIEGKQIELVETKNKLTSSKATLEKLKTENAGKDKLEKKAEELLRIKNYKVLSEQEANLKASALEIGNQKEKYELEFATGKQKVEALKLSIRKTKVDLPDLSLLSEQREWFAVLKGIDLSLEEKEKAFAMRSASLSNENIKLTELHLSPGVQELLPKNTENVSPEELIRNLDEGLTKGESFVDEKTGEIGHLKFQLEHASNLQEGELCPLCGSTHHPDLANEDELKSAFSKSESLRQRASDKLNRIKILRQSLETISLRLDSEHKEKQKSEAELGRVKQKREAHISTAEWKDFEFNRPDLLLAKIRESESQQEKITLLEAELSGLEKKWEDKENDLKLLDKNRASIENELSGVSSKLELLNSQFTILDPSDYAAIKAQDIQSESEQILSQLNKLASQLELEEKQVRDFGLSIVKNETELEGLRKNAASESARSEKLKKEIENRIEKTTLKNRAEVKILLALERDLTKEKQDIEDFKNELLKVKTRIGELSKVTKDSTFELKVFEELKQKLTNQLERDGLVKERIVEIRIALDQLKEKIEIQKELIGRKEKLDLRASNLSTMKKLFNRSGFVNYVSTIYLEELAARANERFRKMTRNVLQLEVTDSNQFQVRDFLNGGQVRNVKTLSGGQTFQAALCLALALADNIHQDSKSDRNFFFLDEGFGTLDKDSLQVVFETLKELRRENRIVGVISHVEELQQEIGVFLNIINDPEKGSIVFPSWEA